MLMSVFFSWTEFFSLDKHLELRHSELDLQQITKYSVHPSIDQVFTLEIQKITKYLLLHARRLLVLTLDIQQIYKCNGYDSI